MSVKESFKKAVTGYLPDERPSTGKLLLFALQQILVMFPATVTVALLTRFDIATTIFASGFATLCFIFITKGKIPLYYGSSFSYIAAICSLTFAKSAVTGQPVEGAELTLAIQQAQFGIICSGVVSIIAGFIVRFLGMKRIEKVLPATVTGSIAMVIGISLAGTAITFSASNGVPGGPALDNGWIAAIVTLLATILFSVYLRGIWGQLPILLGIIVGYIVSIPLGLVDFTKVWTGNVIAVPNFTLPVVSWPAVFAIAPIAIATIPESTAHLFQLDIYVNDLADKKGKPRYDIANRLDRNLIGDGIGDIVSSLFGGPAGTNYGENISTMAITKNFSIWMLGAAAVITMGISFLEPLANAVRSIPGSVINGACIYLFGVIAAQGVAIMINKKVDMFSAKNLAVIATILVIGLGGHYGYSDNMIPIFGVKLPAIATAALFGILLNGILSIGKKKEEETKTE